MNCSRPPEAEDKTTFINTFYGSGIRGFGTGFPKKTVLVLRIKNGKENLYLVIRNDWGDRHAEVKLKSYLDNLSRSRSMPNYLKTCKFVIYMNYAPCNNCADVLIKLFNICNGGSVKFTGLYTRGDNRQNYLGWESLKENVAFRYMQQDDYDELGIAPPISVVQNNREHNRYAARKMPENCRDDFIQFSGSLL